MDQELNRIRQFFSKASLENIFALFLQKEKGMVEFEEFQDTLIHL